MRRHYTLFLTGCLLLSISGFAQSIDDQFNKGLILYRNHQYTAAEDNFSSLVQNKEPHSKSAIASLMLAKTYLNQQDYHSAISTAEQLIRSFPNSSYKAHAFYVIGTAKYFQDSFKEAIQAFAFAIEYSQEAALTEQAAIAATKVAASHSSLNEMQNMATSFDWRKASNDIKVWTAQKNLQKGRIDQGKRIIDELLESRPGERIALQAQDLLAKDWTATSDHIRIGIILPLSGMYSFEANDFIRGMAFALKNRQQTTEQIDLIVKDSKGSTVSLIKETRLLLDEDIDIIVGELEGSMSATVAALADEQNIPVVVPVTTENGIAGLGDYVFQANNDSQTRGQVLAEYAFNKLGLKRFATLAPADDYGHTLTDAFTSTIDKLGGMIVSQQWYYSGTEDFKPQFESIRRAGFNLAFRDSLQKAGLPSTKTNMDSLLYYWNTQSKRTSDDNIGLVKNYDIPVESIDGFFLPVYGEDIPFIASQMALANIKAELLGGEYWHDTEILKRQQRYVNGVVMVSGNFLDMTDLNYITFVRDFRIQTASTPETFAYYGFNVMNLILQAINVGNDNGAEIAQYLNKINFYKGLGIDISFQGHNRVNKSVNLLQFQDGLVTKISHD